MNGLYTILYLGIGSLDAVSPKTETCKVGSDAWHLEGYRLERGIAPRLVVRRIDGEVLGYESLVIEHVEQTVVAIKIAWCEDELNLVFLAVPHIVVLEHAKHVIVGHIVEPVGYHRALERSVIDLLGVSQTLVEVGTSLAHPCWHIYKGKHSLIEARVAIEAIECLDEHVDALVAELIAARGTDDESIVRKLAASEGVGKAKNRLARCLAHSCELSALGHEIVLEAIGQYNVNGLDKLLTLCGSDVGNGGEAINIVSGLLLYGVLRLHVEFLCHLVAIVSPEVVIERLVIACYGATDRRSVGGKHSTDSWYLVLDVEGTQACHPLVSVVYDLRILQLQEVIHRLYHQACGIGEHACLVIVAISMEGIYLKMLPKFCVNGVFLSEIWFKVNENGNRRTWNVPATNLDVYILCFCLLLPVGKQVFILLEKGIGLITPTVGTDKDKVVMHSIL